jgi:RNA polymerase sigma factor (sigma-70 family)
MNSVKVHTLESMSDFEIVEAILSKDKTVTYEFLYRKCYPLFKSIFNKYYTDCQNCIEFITEIYLLIITQNKESKVSPLSTFGFRCTFTMWLKIVAENHCKRLYKKRIITEDSELEQSKLKEENNVYGIDMTHINILDVQTILSQIKNDRYRNLIQLRYLEGKTNEETAEILNMSMANYSNKHKLAKLQMTNVLIKEGIL